MGEILDAGDVDTEIRYCYYTLLPVYPANNSSQIKHEAINWVNIGTKGK